MLNTQWPKARQGDPQAIDQVLKIMEANFRIGIDVAGLGRDMSVFCYRRDNYVEKFESLASSYHMKTVGRIKNSLVNPKDMALTDMIGEGAGVFSLLKELASNSFSVRFSEAANNLHDMSGQLSFA